MNPAEPFHFDFQRLNDLKQIVTDSSTMILAERAGFLMPFLGALQVHAPQAVVTELRHGHTPDPEHDPYAALTPHQGRSTDSTDIQVLDLAATLSFPLASDDFRILGDATTRGDDAYPSLAILELLLLRRVLTATQYDRCRTKLADLIHYPDPVYRACVDLHWQVRKYTG